GPRGLPSWPNRRAASAESNEDMSTSSPTRTRRRSRKPGSVPAPSRVLSEWRSPRRCMRSPIPARSLPAPARRFPERVGAQEDMGTMGQAASTIAHSIRLARAGREDLLGELLDAQRNYLRVLAAAALHRDVRGKADASDVVQDTLLKAHQRFRQFR